MSIILSIIFSLISLFLVNSEISKAIKKFYLLLILINFLGIGIYIFLDFLSGDGINDAVLYHLYFGITGFGINDYYIPISMFLIYVFGSFMLIYFINTKLNQKKIPALFKNFIPIFMVFSLIANPFFRNIYELYYERNLINTDQNYVNHNFLIEPKDYLFGKEKKNIIYLYLEQFERTYFNESIFPGLTPNLKRLEKEAISFSNIDSPNSTNWTISGMVASQCGIPIIVPDYRGNSMSGMDKFLPLADCLGDILNNNGYALHYIGGSNLDFAGKGNFYATHGFNVVEGLNELNGQLNKKYLSPWGLFDDTLFKIIQNRYQDLSNENKPFGIFSLTLDTHHPNGYISDSCKDLFYKDGKNPILNSVHCTDMLVGKFIDSFQSNSAFINTTLVVSSDHLALRNTASSLLEQADRKNLFLIFDQSISPGLISKPGSMFDIAPTVLSVMGVHLKGMGLGRNLFFESSLREHNLNIESIIEIHKNEILSLWAFPQINNKFNISLQDRVVNFDEREIKLPVLILLDEFLNVEEMRFDFYFSNPLINEVKSTNNNSNLLWIDQCETILEHVKVKVVLDEIQFCSYMFRKGDASYKITDLQREVLDYEKFNLFFK